jgi:hypothetical protein
MAVIYIFQTAFSIPRQNWPALVNFFVANTFQIQPFHKGLAKQADVAPALFFWFENIPSGNPGQFYSRRFFSQVFGFRATLMPKSLHGSKLSE